MRAAAVQLNSTDDLERNLETADRLTRKAAQDGARLVVLPEKWPALGTNDVVRSGAQTLGDGPAVKWAREVAREVGVDLVAGSIALRDGDRLRNTAIHVGPDGDIHATYAKIHLFDVEVDGRTYRESEHEDAGDEVVTTTLQDGTELGLAVCYDLRFPTLFEELVHRGATAIALPSAFTERTTQDHWEVLIRARAIEQQAFVIAANQVGEHPGGMKSGGQSMIVDPWGVVLARAESGEGLAVADLDRAAQERVRSELPALTHRRVHA